VDLVALLAIFLVLLAIVSAVSAPLRAARRGSPAGEAELDVEALEAARDAKYREIREAELDLQTGKLSAADHRALEATLRAEAVAVLHALDEARGRAGEEEAERVRDS